MIFFRSKGRIPGARPRNRAFRCKSSEAPMRFLWAFRCNPLAPHGLFALRATF
ncbi:MAG: hypothetical protein LBK44_01955 [Spirochaetales bacterium]|nr:hypothetical protein [Spirochaetales bacterium]